MAKFIEYLKAEESQEGEEPAADQAEEYDEEGEYDAEEYWWVYLIISSLSGSWGFGVLGFWGFGPMSRTPVRAEL